MKWRIWTHLVYNNTLSHALSLPFPFTTPTPFLIFITRPLSSSLISLRRCAVQRRGAYLWCEHACVITHLPCVMVGSSGATDSASTAVMRTDDCAWKQKRSRLIWLSSTSERLLAGVRGHMMRKHKASTGLLSLFVCVGSAEVRLVGRVSHSNHTGLHTHTFLKGAHTHTHTDKDTQKACTLKHARLRALGLCCRAS